MSSYAFYTFFLLPWFMYRVFNERSYWLIRINIRKTLLTSIQFLLQNLKLSPESCFALSLIMLDYIKSVLLNKFSSPKLSEEKFFTLFTRLAYFFPTWDFFHKHSRFAGTQEKDKAIYLTSLYYFHPLSKIRKILDASVFSFVIQNEVKRNVLKCIFTAEVSEVSHPGVLQKKAIDTFVWEALFRKSLNTVCIVFRFYNPKLSQEQCYKPYVW